MTDFTLDLITAIAPAKKFTVDGEQYDLLGIDHLDDNTEAEVMALFARYGVLTTELDLTANVVKGKELAQRVKTTRLDILAKLTTSPKAILAKLPLTEQVRLLGAIENSIGERPDAESTGDGS